MKTTPLKERLEFNDFKRIPGVCIICGKPLKGGKKYCSNKCLYKAEAIKDKINRQKALERAQAIFKE